MIRIVIISAVAMVVVMGLFAGAAYGTTATRSGDGSDNSWQTTGNWSGLNPGDDYPGEGGSLYDVNITDTIPRPNVEVSVAVDVQNLTIGTGMTVTIRNGGRIHVQDDNRLQMTGTGIIKIERGANLYLQRAGELCAPSCGRYHSIAGNPSIELLNTGSTTANAKLTVQGDVTFRGGGAIKGNSTANNTINGPEGAATTHTLLIENNVKIHGELEISANLHNKGLVVADGTGSDTGTELKLVNSTKTGESGGIWRADGGKLNISTTVQDAAGNANWEIEITTGSEIEVNSACSALMGTLDADGGLLDINATFDLLGQCWIDGEVDASATFECTCDG